MVLAALVLFALSAGILCAAATWGLLRLLRRKAVFDTPNARSNHTVPTPRGGGIAVIAVILLIWGYAFGLLGGLSLMIVPMIAIAVLAIVGWWDDVHKLPALPRLLAQIAAIAATLPCVLPETSVGGLPYGVAALLLGFLWLWGINLTNFMDGIDGITGMETGVISVGIAGVVLITDIDFKVAVMAVTVAGAAAGFLLFNWHPAKLFLGDVGSVPLGFLLGFLLLILVISGHWPVALIFPAYYISDATFTLLRRMANGERFWEAHSQHIYQQAVRAGMPHDRVVLRIATLNAVLLALGWASVAVDSPAGRLGIVAVAYLLTAVFLWYLKPKNNPV